ncbi:hypothetical protein AC578_8352 [Pseudocercospora eumusae]|uniref:Uncharacterized protein n=1 Tax=Pseudocercospora eumusae TaxID=321146 RepID=A0A139HS44_9PEZI|nr:hypothetical protein AC578_8352 [Pseudocercospora eumusae]
MSSRENSRASSSRAGCRYLSSAHEDALDTSGFCLPASTSDRILDVQEVEIVCLLAMLDHDLRSRKCLRTEQALDAHMFRVIFHIVPAL